MVKRFIHPKFVDSLAGFFPDTCVIQSSTEVLGDNHETGTYAKTWTDTLTDIRATIGDSRGEEVRQKDKTYAISSHKICLQGDYAVTEKQRAVIDSINYDILSVDKDSRTQLTRLICRRIIW